VLQEKILEIIFFTKGLHRRAQNKDFSLIPGLENTRDFLDASTVMSELIRLARSVDFPALVNICSGKGKTIREIAKDVFSLYGFEKKIEKMHSPKEDSPTKIIGVPTIFK
jgi:nucleoside-diphosphate-sugar epimerase